MTDVQCFYYIAYKIVITYQLIQLTLHFHVANIVFLNYLLQSKYVY